MSNSQNTMMVFQNEAPEVAEAFNGLIKAISSQPGLDAKTRQLIYIGIKAAQGESTAVTAHVPMARAAGASRMEIRDTILLTTTVSGVRGIVTCLADALKIYDQIENGKGVS